MAADEIRIHPLRCGTLSAAGEAFVAGAEGVLDLQVWSFLVEHPSGPLLFDTGMHPQLRSDAKGRIGGLADLFEIRYGDDEDVVSRVGSAGVDPASVPVIVASHLHFDHVGGNELLPDARVVVQRREWEHARRGDDGAYVPADLALGHDLELVDGEHDLFGDGRVICVPTYGHTPGHQSLLVRLAEGDVLLTADACYLRQ